jgi:hypothetical protein
MRCNSAKDILNLNFLTAAAAATPAGAAGMFLRVFCQIAAALQEQGAAAMAPGAIWSQAAGQFNGEQLAYIAALASGSQLLFGDRPKDITYKWVVGC